MHGTEGSGRAWGTGLLAAVALTALTAALPPAAAAVRHDPVGAGTTALHLSRSFTRQLRSNGVKLRAVQGAKLRGRSVVFPTSAGRLDSEKGVGTIKHGGAL